MVRAVWGQMAGIKAGRKLLFTMSKGFVLRLQLWQLGNEKKFWFLLR